MKTRETSKAIKSKKSARGGAGPKVAESATGAAKGDRAARAGISKSAWGAERSKPFAEIDRLATMKIGELQALVVKLTGETTRCPNRAWLIKKVVEAAAPTMPVDAPATATALAAGSTDPEARADDPATEGAPGPEGGPMIEVASSMPAVDPAATTGHSIADQAATPAATGTATASDGSPALPKLSKLDVPALRSLYVEVVGRETRSTNVGYLRWKISQARRGAIPTGLRKASRAEGTTFKVLPLRMESGLVDKLDEAWRRQGMASRMELFRVALGAYLTNACEKEVAAFLSP